jgi:outer membrane protein
LKFYKIFLCFSVLFYSLVSYSNSLTLAEVYEIALTEDPQLKIAQATYKANKEAKAKGIAGLLPSITTRARTNWNESEVIKGASATYDSVGSKGNNSYSYSADLVQPIFRPDRWFQFGQGKALSKIAKAQFGYAQQETIVRVTETYFDLLKAIKNLEVAKSEESAIKKQRDRSKRLFEEGVSSVTEYQEAQAFYDLSKVSRIASEGQLEFAREALIAIIGEAPDLVDLNDEYPISPPNPKSRQEWVGLGLSNNFALQAARMSTKAAKRNAQSKLSNHFPDIDLVGNISRDTSRGISGFDAGSFSYGESEIENTRYSLQFSWPLMAGGLVSSERREAYALLEKARQEEILSERGTIREVKSRFSSVLTNLANVNAREQALKSSELALKATRFGYESNTRNIVDLLNSEKGYFSAQRDFNSAKYDFILSEFALKISSGSLSPRDIYDISNFMTK